MIAPSERKAPIKVAGYLEKRSKMKVVCRWKKLWFVLDGRLLLYYKSQLEYLSLSPCRGTLNLGLAARVSVGPRDKEIILTTRSNTVCLRALSRSEHEQWLQALMEALHLSPPPLVSSSVAASQCLSPVRHFRYSTGGLEDGKSRTFGEYLLNHSQTLSGRLSPEIQCLYELPEPQDNRPTTTESDLKLDKLPHRLGRIAGSDTTLAENLKQASRNNLKTNVLRRTVSVDDEVNRLSENIYETLNSKIYFNPPRRVIRSDSDRLVARERIRRQPVFRSEQRIRSLFDTSNNEAFIDMLNNKILDKCASSSLDKPLRMKYGSDMALERTKNIKSDPDLSLRKDLYHSGSCTALYSPLLTEAGNIPTRLSRGCDFYQYSGAAGDYSRSEELFGRIPCGSQFCRKPKRSNSILRHFLRSKPLPESLYPPPPHVKRRQSLKGRSLSFLRKIWKKKEPKFDDDDISFNTELDMREIHRPSSDFTNSSTYSTVEVGGDYEVPLPEPAPDYGQLTDGEEPPPPALPPRSSRGPSPWQLEAPEVEETDLTPPVLPIKKRRRAGGGVERGDEREMRGDSWETGDSSGLLRLFSETAAAREETVASASTETATELARLMEQLAAINASPIADKPRRSLPEEEPDYDIPRPHDSLLYSLQQQPRSGPPALDSIEPTNFFSNFQDSLDLSSPQRSDGGGGMAPDSLECDPWTPETQSGWTTPDSGWTTVHAPPPPSSVSQCKTIVSSVYGTNKEIYFKDTIKTPKNQTNFLNIHNSKFIQLHT